MRLDIARITVGPRRREDLGDLDALARSIAKYDLLHPVVIDDSNQLIAGHRRLEACKRLGWTDIPVREIGSLTETERREIELEENVRRKDLSEYERSKNLVELVAKVRVSETWPDSGQVVKPARGPARTPGSDRDVAERIDVPRSTIQKAESHVAVADAYPFTQAWKQYQVLEIGEVLDTLPEEDRPRVAAMVAPYASAPRDVIQTVRNVAQAAPAERARILTLAESPDSRDRDRAITDAAQRPPMPDPRLSILQEMRHLGRRAARLFSDDPHNERIAATLPPIEAAIAAFKETPC